MATLLLAFMKFIFKSVVLAHVPILVIAFSRAGSNPDIQQPLINKSHNRSGYKSLQKEHLSYKSASSERDLKISEFLNLDDREKAYALFKARSDQMTSADFEIFQQQILMVWAEEDPAKVTKILSSLTSKKTREIVIESIANGWAINDISKGFDFLESPWMEQVNPEVFDRSYAALIDQYAREDVVPAAQMLEEFESEAFQAERLHTITENYADLNYSDSLDWAYSLKSDTIRNLAMLHLFDRYDESEAGTLSAIIKEHNEKLSPYVLKKASNLLKLD